MTSFSIKNTKIILVAIVVIVILIGGFLLYFQNQAPKDLSKIYDKQIISLLEKNTDSNDYITNHPDFKIQDKIVLTKDSILAGQNGQNFKEVYQGLKLEDNRYLKVDLMNASGNNGLVAVLDFKMNQTVKAYGKLLLQGSVQQ